MTSRSDICDSKLSSLITKPILFPISAKLNPNMLPIELSLFFSEGHSATFLFLLLMPWFYSNIMLSELCTLGLLITKLDWEYWLPFSLDDTRD